MAALSAVCPRARGLAGVKGGTVSGQPDPIEGVGLARDSLGRILGWSGEAPGGRARPARGRDGGEPRSGTGPAANWGQGEVGGSRWAGRGGAWRGDESGRGRRARGAPGKGPGGRHAQCTPNDYEGQGRGGGRGEPPFGKLRAGSSTGSGQALRRVRGDRRRCQAGGFEAGLPGHFYGQPGRGGGGQVFTACRRCVQFSRQCVHFWPRCVHFSGQCVQSAAECVQSGLTTRSPRRPRREGSRVGFGAEVRRRPCLSLARGRDGRRVPGEIPPSRRLASRPAV